MCQCQCLHPSSVVSVCTECIKLRNEILYIRSDGCVIAGYLTLLNANPVTWGNNGKEIESPEVGELITARPFWCCWIMLVMMKGHPRSVFKCCIHLNELLIGIPLYDERVIQRYIYLQLLQLLIMDHM